MLFLIIALLYIVGGHIGGTRYAKGLGERRVERYETAKVAVDKYIKRGKTLYYEPDQNPVMKERRAKRAVQKSLLPPYLWGYVIWLPWLIFEAALTVSVYTARGVGAGYNKTSRVVTNLVIPEKLRELQKGFRKEIFDKEVKALEEALLETAPEVIEDEEYQKNCKHPSINYSKPRPRRCLECGVVNPVTETSAAADAKYIMEMKKKEDEYRRQISNLEPDTVKMHCLHRRTLVEDKDTGEIECMDCGQKEKGCGPGGHPSVSGFGTDNCTCNVCGEKLSESRTVCTHSRRELVPGSFKATYNSELQEARLNYYCPDCQKTW